MNGFCQTSLSKEVFLPSVLCLALLREKILFKRGSKSGSTCAWLYFVSGSTESKSYLPTTRIEVYLEKENKGMSLVLRAVLYDFSRERILIWFSLSHLTAGLL